MPISEEGTYYDYSLFHIEILGDTMGIKISCLLKNLVLLAKILKFTATFQFSFSK